MMKRNARTENISTCWKLPQSTELPKDKHTSELPTSPAVTSGCGGDHHARMSTLRRGGVGGVGVMALGPTGLGRLASMSELALRWPIDSALATCRYALKAVTLGSSSSSSSSPRSLGSLPLLTLRWIGVVDGDGDEESPSDSSTRASSRTE